MNCVTQCSVLLVIIGSLLISEVHNLETVPIEFRIIGGRIIEPDKIKYLVSLQTDGEHFCGGSIIGDKFILSAAHCFIDERNEFNEDPVKVIAGTNNLRDENSKPIELEIDKIYVPSKYNNSDWESSIPYGDIAVLRLKQSLNLKNNSNLEKLNLPRVSKRHRYKTYEGKRVVVAGFGWNKVKVKTSKNQEEYEVGSSNGQMFKANAKVISNRECQQSYTNTIHRSELCAKMNEHEDDTEQGVCRGDSGGALVLNHITIIGVVSGIANGCNENTNPGVYTRVSSHMGFIKNALRDNTSKMRVKTIE